VPAPEPVRLLYDGDCPFCAKSAVWLCRRDANGRIRPVDIRTHAFDPAQFGLTREQVEGALHAVFPDGRAVSRMDAVRAALDAAGLSWLSAPTRWRPLRAAFDRAYDRMARNRVQRIGS
jgi:predicted DCC family thiol-disulfide oxidoreductase YuxK